jgi:hypothetical protein
MDQRRPIVEVNIATLHALLERIGSQVSHEDHEMLKTVVENLLHLTSLVRERGATIARLRRFIGHSSSEKTARVLGKPGKPVSDGGGAAPGQAPAGAPPATGAAAPQAHAKPDAAPDVGPGAGAPKASDESGAGTPAQEEPKPTPKTKGHGRVPAADYLAARHIPVPHDSLQPGASCPHCHGGKIYELKEPAPWLRIVGQAPLAAICWDCQRLRCSTCGDVFTARAPHEAQGEKYTETAASMMALLRYGAGMPGNRLDHLQCDLETPVPSSTQWDVLDQRVELIRPAYDELRRQAAQGAIVHNDDTYVRILAVMGKRRAELLLHGELEDPERTGLFTTAIVSISEARQPIAVFATGRKHAGENLTALLAQRAVDLPPPIQMCDALARNLPQGHAVIEANCIAHGRRKIVDEVANFPAECEHVLDALSRVYHVDQQCKQQGLSADERLRRHQHDSAPVIDALQAWMTAQLADKRIEPNSGLGRAFHYMLKRWDKLTLFLRTPGAPLDNNICERALKMAIRHRNNSLFYRTEHGACVGDIYMTLIHTAALHRQNPFDYLTALQVHAKAVAEHPADWMPWNYRATLARLPHQGPPRSPEPHAPGPLGHPAERASPRHGRSHVGTRVNAVPCSEPAAACAPTGPPPQPTIRGPGHCAERLAEGQGRTLAHRTPATPPAPPGVPAATAAPPGSRLGCRHRAAPAAHARATHAGQRRFRSASIGTGPRKGASGTANTLVHRMPGS